MDIVYQRQTHPQGCVHACIGMYKGIPQEDIHNEFPPGEGSILTTRRMLVHYGIPYLDVHPMLWMNIPGFHLLSISIGHDERHSVLSRVNPDGTFDIWDPALGEQLATKYPFLGDIVEVQVLLDENDNNVEMYGPGS